MGMIVLHAAHYSGTIALINRGSALMIGRKIFLDSVTLPGYRSAGSQSCATRALRTYPNIKPIGASPWRNERARPRASRKHENRHQPRFANRTPSGPERRSRRGGSNSRRSWRPAGGISSRRPMLRWPTLRSSLAFTRRPFPLSPSGETGNGTCRRLRDVSPATRILVETENLERRRETGQSGPDVEPHAARRRQRRIRERPCRPPAACGAQRAHRGRVRCGTA